MRGCAVVSHLQARPNQSHAARIALGIRAGDVVCDTVYCISLASSNVIFSSLQC